MKTIISSFLALQSHYPHLCFLLASALKSSGIVMLGWSTAWLLKSRSGVARSWVWRCTLLGLLLAAAIDFSPNAFQGVRPAFSVRTTPEQEQPFSRKTKALYQRVTLAGAKSPVGVQTDNSNSFANASPEVTRTSSELSPRRASVWSLVEAYVLEVWAGGTGLLLAVGIVRIWYSAHRLRRDRTRPTSATTNSCRAIAAELQIKSDPHVFLARPIQSPLILGIFYPTIYLPADSSAWSVEKARAVFVHELAHWKRADHWWQIVARIAACVFWWNPLAAVVGRRTATEAEIAADDAVLIQHIEAPIYAAALVEIASGEPTRNLLNAGVPMLGQQSLEDRIKRLLAINPWRGRVGLLAAGLLALLVVTLVIGTAVHVTEAKGDSRNDEILQIVCVDMNDAPVADAEILAYQVGYSEGEPSYTYLAPSKADGNGNATLRFPPADENAEDVSRAVFARVDGKLIGNGRQFARRPGIEGNVIKVIMVPTFSARGRIITPPGYSPQQIRVSFSALTRPKGDTDSRSWGWIGFEANRQIPSHWPNWFAAVPDENGTFVLKTLPQPGDPIVSATGPGLGEAQHTVRTLDRDPVSKEVEFTLTVQPAAAVSGRVTGPPGTPRAGQKVFVQSATGPLRSQRRYSALTDNDGRFWIGDLSADSSFQVWVTPDDHLVGSVALTRTLGAGETQTDFNLVMTHGCLVSGNVTRGDSKAPLSGIEIWGRSGTNPRSFPLVRLAHPKTDAAGHYLLRLPPGPAEIYVYDADGFEFDRNKPTVSDQKITVAENEQTRKGVDFVLQPLSEARKSLRNQPKPTVHGKVLDPKGNPLEGVPVYFLQRTDPETGIGANSGTLGLTKSDGSFASEVNQTQELTIGVGGIGFSSVKRPAFNSKTKPDYDLGTFTVRPANATVSGKVVDANGAPIADVNLLVFSQHMWPLGRGNEFVSAADGHFYLPHVLDDETVGVQATKYGYAESNRVDFKPNETNAVITLKAAGGRTLLGTWEKVEHEPGEKSKLVEVPDQIAFKTEGNNDSEEPAEVLFSDDASGKPWRYHLSGSDWISLKPREFDPAAPIPLVGASMRGKYQNFSGQYQINGDQLTFKWWVQGYRDATSVYKRVLAKP